MAIDQTKLKKTRHPGVFKTPDGRLWARAAVRQPSGKVVTQRRLLPEGASEADAVQAVLDLRTAIKSPPSIPTPRPPTSSTTVGDYAEGWLRRRRQKVKPSTAITYELALGNHILPRLAHLTCEAVGRAALEGWTIWAEAQVDRKGRPYSNDTLKQWWRVLCNVLKDMAAELHLPDPTYRVKPPERPQEAPRREQRTLEADDLADVVEAAKFHTPKRFAEIAVLLLTGMRAGEVYALKWDSIDLDTGIITIRRSISRGKLTETTKTKAQRTVPLHPLLRDIVREHKFAMHKEKPPGFESGLVFPSSKGTPKTPHTLDRAFLRIAKEMGTNLNLGAQVLRRSLNSNLLRQSVDRLTIRAIMGHTSEQMTAQYYGAGESEKMTAVMHMPVRRKKVVDPSEYN